MAQCELLQLLRDELHLVKGRALVRSSLGQAAEAQRLMAEVVELYGTVLGPQHRWTRRAAQVLRRWGETDLVRRKQEQGALGQARSQLEAVGAVVIKSVPHFSGVYSRSGEHRGWPRFSSCRARHLFRCVCEGECAPTANRPRLPAAAVPFAKATKSTVPM